MQFGDQRDWFFQARYGLFVHWGLYAIPAWHEQIWQRRQMDRDTYCELIHAFDPQDFDPDAWLDLMAAGGMRYLCFTTKHHDGFCLWDTKQTDFNVMNSPCGRDLLAELAEACHRRDIPLCLYYSVVDWHQPNYPNEGRHHELPPQPGAEPDMPRYVDFVREQIRELCTHYGRIHGIWWDMNVPEYQDPTVNALIRELQPQAVINDRGFDTGHFTTPERQALEGRAFDQPTEACQSLGMQSWGYKLDEDYYSTRHIMRHVAQTLAMGGNYLLNVGPDADGSIREPFRRPIRLIGEWLERVGEAYFDTTPASHLTDNPDVLLTQREGALYVTAYRDLPGSAISLRPYSTAPATATLLNTGQPLPFQVSNTTYEWQRPPVLRLTGIPIDDLAHEVPVIKLTFQE